MLRERAEPLPEVTDEMWATVCKEHRDLVDEFLQVNKRLAPQSVKQYFSGLRQWFFYVHTYLNDKPIYKITKRDFLKYMSYLQDRNLSSSALKFKKSAVSSLNNYIENVIADDDERYAKFRNFTKSLPAIPQNHVYNKVKITRDEYKLMMDTLLARKDYMGAAWVATSFNVCSRRSETAQFRTEILSYPIPEGQNYVMSHIVRGKGASVDGNQISYMIYLEALKYMRLWVENRGYEHEYIFTVMHNGQPKRISASWADYFCANVLTPIVGRRINVHLFKSSGVSALLEQGVDIALVSRWIAHHEDVSTTSKFYDLRDFDEEKSKIFNSIPFEP
jgi:site-specific recombinase XerD